MRHVRLLTLVGIASLVSAIAVAGGPGESLLGRDEPLAGHKVYLLKDTGDAVVARIDMIRQTQETLDIVYFNIEGEKDLTATMGLAALIHTLRQRQQQGAPIKVRLLLDGLAVRTASPRYLYLLNRAGAEIYVFHKPSGSAFLNPFVNTIGLLLRRMHAKVMIKDGREIITGGRNIGDIYFGGKSETKHGGLKMSKRDMDVYATGPAAEVAQAYFDELIASRRVKPANFIDNLKAAAKRARKQEKQQKKEAEVAGVEPLFSPASETITIPDDHLYQLDDNESRVKINYAKLFDRADLEALLGETTVSLRDPESLETWCRSHRPGKVKACMAGIKRLREANARIEVAIESWKSLAPHGSDLDHLVDGRPIGESYWRDRAQAVDAAQFVADRKGMAGREGGVASHLENLFSKLGDGDQVWIQSPVLVVNKGTRRLLSEGLERGVEIHAIVNGPGSTPNTWYQAGYLLSVNRLLGMGINLCEVQNPLGWPEEKKITNHAKTMVIVRRIGEVMVPSLTFISSYNFDPRSEKLNGEAGLLIEDEEVSRVHLEQILELSSGADTPHACQPVYLADGYPYGKVDTIDSPDERMAQMDPRMRKNVESLMVIMRGRIPVGGVNLYIPLYSEFQGWAARQQP